MKKILAGLVNVFGRTGKMLDPMLLSIKEKLDQMMSTISPNWEWPVWYETSVMLGLMDVLKPAKHPFNRFAGKRLHLTSNRL